MSDSKKELRLKRHKKPVPNMVGMRANAEKALIMKDMGNGHMRPYMWGMSVTVASGIVSTISGTLVSGCSETLVASGTMAGVPVDECVYSLSNGAYYISKNSVEHSVKVKSFNYVSESTNVDVIVFMSTAITVDINDYTGKRGYQTGNY